MTHYKGNVLLKFDPVKAPERKNHEIIKIHAKSKDELRRIWISLTRIAAIKDPHIIQISPQYLYPITKSNDQSESIDDNHENGGGVICVSVELHLRPLDKVINLKLLQRRVEFKIPPSGLIDSIFAIITGIKAIHTAGIVHGCIIPDAILITSQYNVVIGGFLLGILPIHPDSLTIESLIWRSPETIRSILTMIDIEETRLTTASDMWNLGK